MSNLSLQVNNSNGWFDIRDAFDATFKTNENGFFQAEFKVPRDFTFAWEDLVLNEQVYWCGRSLDVAWHGRLSAVAPTAQDDPGHSNTQQSITCSAEGYFQTIGDRTYQGTLGTNTTPEALIGSLFSGGYLPFIASTSIATTGLTGIMYQTPNKGTNHLKVDNVLMNICKLGTSTGLRVVPQVWEDRKLITIFNPNPPVAKYKVYRKAATTLGLKRSLDSVVNRCIVRYRSGSTGALATQVVNDTTSQNALGGYFNGTLVPYIREQIVDITHLNNVTAAMATNYGNAVIAFGKKVKNQGQNIVVSQDYAVYDTQDYTEIPLWKVRAGYYIDVTDLYARGTATVGTGTTSGDYALDTTFYIAATDYNVDTGELTISPEVDTDPSAIIASLTGSNDG